MSPLTPTLPETQTPLIPPGSFLGLPNFATKVQEALDLVNPADMKLVVQKKQEIEQKKSHLTTFIEELKLSQKDDDPSSYKQRLLLSDSEIENILENEIFWKSYPNSVFARQGELNVLGSSFYEYLEVLTEGKSDELKAKMKRKLVKELKLEEVVYGTKGVFAVANGPIKKITYSKAFNDGYYPVKSLDIHIDYVVEPEHFIEFIKKVGRSGIVKSVSFCPNDVIRSFSIEELIELVKQTGVSGVKILSFSSNKLSYFSPQDLIELVKQAGLSGIKSIDLKRNRLWNFNNQDLIELVKQAGLSGINDLNLSNNAFSSLLRGQYFLDLIKQAGLSGIKFLKIGDYHISKTLKLQLDDILNYYNMKLY